MKIVNASYLNNSIPVKLGELSRDRQNRAAEAARVEELDKQATAAVSSAGNNEKFSIKPNPTVRVIQLDQNGVDIKQISKQARSKQNATERNSPTSLYQSTQNYLQSEAISSRLGVDLFA